MNDQSFMHAVVPVIRWIDDRQEGRERPIVYIDVNTLIDKWGKPLSSSQKTVRTLLETYQLFFVAPAPVEPQHYAECARLWPHGVHQSKNTALRRLSHRRRADRGYGCADSLRLRHLQDLG